MYKWVFQIFCLVIVFFAISTPALAADRYSVKSYILIPADWKDKVSSQELDRYKKLISEAMVDVQSFYREKLNGHTFNIDSDIPIVTSDKNAGNDSVTGSTQPSNPSDTSRGATFVEDTFNNVGGDSLIPLKNGEVQVVFVLGSAYSRSSAFGYKDKESGRAMISHLDILFLDTRNELPNPITTTRDRTDHRNVHYDQNYALGTIAHELGHAFGLEQGTEKYGGWGRAHPCTVDYPNECRSNTPLPLPTTEESANSIMSYNGENVLATNGLHSTLFKGFLNTTYNPEVITLYDSPFLNPNHDKAPEPVDSFPQSSPGVGDPTSLVLSTSQSFLRRPSGDQGTQTMTVKNDNSTKIDWKFDPERQEALQGEPNKNILYVREMNGENIGKEYEKEIKFDQMVKISNIEVTARRARLIESMQFGSQPDKTPDELLGVSGEVEGINITLNDTRELPVLIKYKDGGTRPLVFKFTTQRNAGTAPQDSRCLDDLNYCDEASQRTIHKHKGVWRSDRCEFVFDDVGACSASTDSSNCKNGLCKPSLTLTSNGTNLSANWNKVNGANFYAIRLGLNNISPDVDSNDKYGNSDTLSYSHTCQPGQTYYFWVHGMKGEGQYGEAEQKSIVCGGPVQTLSCNGNNCPAPSSVSASCSNGTLAVNWGNVTGASQYALRIDNTSDSFSNSCQSRTSSGDSCLNVNGTSYSYSNAPSGNYDIWIHSIAGDGKTFSSGATHSSIVSCSGSSTSSAPTNSIICNGQHKTLEQMKDELRKAGWGGPYEDSNAVKTTYINTARCQGNTTPSGGSTSQPTTTCTWQDRSPECDWNKHRARAVQQNSCTGEYRYPFYQFQSGNCGYTPGSSEGSMCTYGESYSGGTRTCLGTIQQGACKWNGGGPQDICDKW